MTYSCKNNEANDFIALSAQFFGFFQILLSCSKHRKICGINPTFLLTLDVRVYVHLQDYGT